MKEFNTFEETMNKIIFIFNEIQNEQINNTNFTFIPPSVWIISANFHQEKGTELRKLGMQQK